MITFKIIALLNNLHNYIKCFATWFAPHDSMQLRFSGTVSLMIEITEFAKKLNFNHIIFFLLTVHVQCMQGHFQFTLCMKF